MKTLAEELRQYLVAQGICRYPKVPPSGTLVPCYAERLEGAPDPNSLTGNEATNTLVHIAQNGGIGSQAYLGEAFEEPYLDIVVRTDKEENVAVGLEVQRKIVRALNDKVEFDMGDVRVNHCLVRMPFRRISSPLVGEGYEWQATFYFLVRPTVYEV